MYKDVWVPGAEATYNGLPIKLRKRIGDAVEELCADPRTARNVKKLRGALKDKYRLRVGDWRLIFKLDHQQGRIVVIGLTNRRDAY